MTDSDDTRKGASRTGEIDRRGERGENGEGKESQAHLHHRRDSAAHHTVEAIEMTEMPGRERPEEEDAAVTQSERRRCHSEKDGHAREYAPGV